jgi:hypothetical protein
LLLACFISFFADVCFAFRVAVALSLERQTGLWKGRFTPTAPGNHTLLLLDKTFFAETVVNRILFNVAVGNPDPSRTAVFGAGTYPSNWLNAP